MYGLVLQEFKAIVLKKAPNTFDGVNFVFLNVFEYFSDGSYRQAFQVTTNATCMHCNKEREAMKDEEEAYKCKAALTEAPWLLLDKPGCRRRVREGTCFCS
jgi:hypothetical protein